MKNLSRSRKKQLGISLGLLCTTSIAAPIAFCTSCGENITYIDKIDEQFDVSSVTYNAAKRDFKVLYRDKLEQQWLSEEEIEEEMKYLDKELDAFDETLRNSEKQKQEDAKQLRLQNGYSSSIDESQYYDYTTMTTALVEFASEKYDIHLNRKSTAAWSDITEAYLGLRSSSELYMQHLGTMSQKEIEDTLAFCDGEASAMMNDLQIKYGDDALTGLMVALPKLFSCFDVVNLDIAAISATDRLKEFFSKYTLVFNEDGTNNHYDEIVPKLKEGDVIGKADMQNMFKCVEQKTGDTIDYDPDVMIPGYTLTPILHEKLPDPIHNTYKISIDWALMNNFYLLSDDETKELATGHIYGKSQDVLDGKFDDNTPIAEVMRSCEIQYLEYDLYPTAKYERKQLENAYFNPKSENGYIRFKWNDNISDNKYEEFFAGIAGTTEKDTEGTLTLKNLANSGLQISDDDQYYTDVNELLDTVGPDQQLEDEETLTLAQEFIRNCDVKSHVTIKDADKHLVTNKFSIEYLNSHNKGDDNHWYTGLPLFYNNGYPISPEFFIVANETYNDAKEWIDFYRNKDIDAIYDEADKLIISLTCGAAYDALMTAYYCFRLVVPLTMLIDGVPRPNWACAVALGVAQAVLLATYITLVTKMMIIPLKQCAKRNETFLKSASTQKMIEKIDSDEHWFCLRDKNGKYNKTLYDIKLKEFCMANFQTEARPLYQYYSNFHYQQDSEDFVKGIVDNKIDSVTIQSITDPYTLPTGIVNKFSASYIAASFVISLALGPTTNPFNPLKWGVEFWLWVLTAGVDATFWAIRFSISFIIEHTIRKFVTGDWF